MTRGKLFNIFNTCVPNKRFINTKCIKKININNTNTKEINTKHISNIMIFWFGSTIVFSSYGFTRGFRSNYFEPYNSYEEPRKYHQHFVIKIVKGFINAFFYSVPILNLIFLENLVLRITNHCDVTNVSNNIICDEIIGHCPYII
jgi:hypothetical protein